MQNALHFARCFRCFLLSRAKKWNNWEQQPSWLPKMCSLNADAPQRDIKSNELSSFKAWYRHQLRITELLANGALNFEDIFGMCPPNMVSSSFTWKEWCAYPKKKKEKKTTWQWLFFEYKRPTLENRHNLHQFAVLGALIATSGAGQLKQMMLISFQDVSTSPK